MLQHATTAAAEMAAGRIDPSVAGIGDDFGEGVPAVASRLQRTGGDGFSRQGQRQVERGTVRQAGDAVAFGPDTVDMDLCGFGRFTAGGFLRALGHSAPLIYADGAERNRQGQMIS